LSLVQNVVGSTVAVIADQELISQKEMLQHFPVSAGKSSFRGKTRINH
jgi:hypothetical protein